MGSVSAVQGAVVSAELAGVVSEINFDNGAEAKKGEVLMKLDASQEEALLRSAEADAQLAQHGSRTIPRSCHEESRFRRRA